MISGSPAGGDLRGVSRKGKPDSSERIPLLSATQSHAPSSIDLICFVVVVVVLGGGYRCVGFQQGIHGRGRGDLKHHPDQVIPARMCCNVCVGRCSRCVLCFTICAPLEKFLRLRCMGEGVQFFTSHSIAVFRLGTHKSRCV